MSEYEIWRWLFDDFSVINFVELVSDLIEALFEATLE